MRLTRPAIVTLAASVATLITATTLAEAQTRRNNARPLTVQRRSFLDLGKVVPIGTESRYVESQTRFNHTPDYDFFRGKYGRETLPGPFDLPGR